MNTVRTLFTLCFLAGIFGGSFSRNEVPTVNSKIDQVVKVALENSGGTEPQQGFGLEATMSICPECQDYYNERFFINFMGLQGQGHSLDFMILEASEIALYETTPCLQWCQ